jgi:tagatose-1,6-bisphosphate aldolase
MFGFMAVLVLIFSTEKAEKYKHSTALVCVPCRSCQASDILFSIEILVYLRIKKPLQKFLKGLFM